MQANCRDRDQKSRYMASDLGLHFVSMSRKKDARPICVNMCVS